MSTSSLPRIDSRSIHWSPLLANSNEGALQEEYRNSGAFARLRAEGSVVTGGKASYGGDSQAVAEWLSGGVVQLAATYTAFAALKDDGSVVAWGDGGTGGDTSALAALLNQGVVRLFSTAYAFAALKADGAVVSWGSSGLVDPEVARDVAQIFTTSDAFAALKTDGSVLTWGASNSGGDSRCVADSLSGGVLQIVASSDAFAALKTDGSVVSWGYGLAGGSNQSVAEQLMADVVQLSANTDAFAALKIDGSVVTWGNSRYGGDSSAVAPLLEGGVVQVFASSAAFAALKVDGSVVTWGQQSAGGDSAAVAELLSGGVIQIFANQDAFAALKADGSVVTWGASSSGGNSSAVAEQLEAGVVQIFSIGALFAAVKADGSVVTWGASQANTYTGSLSNSLIQLFSGTSSFSGWRADNWGSGGYTSNSVVMASLIGSLIMALADMQAISNHRLSAELIPMLSIPSEVRSEVIVGQAAALSGFMVADGENDALTLTLTASNGRLGNLVDADPDTPGIQLTGSAAEINAALAVATFIASSAGLARIELSLSDGKNIFPVTATYYLNAALIVTNQAPSFYVAPEGFQNSLVTGPVINLPNLIVADAEGDTLTLTLLATNGLLSNLNDADLDVAGIQLIGSATEINTALAEATFTTIASGLSTIEFSLTDGQSESVILTQTLISSTEAPEEQFISLYQGTVTTLDAGAGDDTYRLADFLSPNVGSFILNDTQGQNSLQLEDGLYIQASRASNSVLEFTLENGTQVTLVDADRFTYNLGDSQAKGAETTTIGFDAFVQDVLGMILPTGPLVAIGGAVQINRAEMQEASAPISLSGVLMPPDGHAALG